MDDMAAGQLRMADVKATKLDRHKRHKYRPVVLVSRCATGWWCAGLTTLPRYGNGQPRVPIPNPTAVGLTKPGFLWGGKLVRLPMRSIGRMIGVADEQLVMAVAEAMRGEITELDVDAMLAARGRVA